jgi:glutaredoxin
MSSIHRSRTPSHLGLALAVACAGFLLVSIPAAADWLVTRDGQRIETEGRWQMKGKAVLFTQVDGRVDQLPRDYIDFEASHRATRGEPPKIIMYATSWCPYCRRARKLLNSLDVEWVEKDIEKDRDAAREFIAKAGRGAGVPVIDFDGTLLRGFNQHKIRRLVAEVQKTQRVQKSK